jgi:hypothetical protein
MTRRELLLLGKRLLALLVGWKFLGGFRQLHGSEEFYSQLPALIGYLLYDNNPPSRLRVEIDKHMKKNINSTLAEQLELEIFSKMDIKCFDALLPEEKKVVVKKILPELMQYPEIIDIINDCLQEERVLQYLDYPDLPGDFGECGWLVLEGDVWDRYYPPTS